MTGRACFSLLASTAAALTLAPIALPYAAFRTPGRAAYCGLSEGETPTALICWTPNDGFGVSMRATGRAVKAYAPGDKGLYEDFAPVLGFGRTWRASNLFECVRSGNPIEIFQPS